jgi:hypothetical protein
MEDKELQELRIKEILEALQEKFIVTIDWDYINKNKHLWKI